MSPTVTPALNIPLVYGKAGNSTWFTYAIATLGLVFVGLTINQLTRGSASAGGLYTYVARGLGPAAGVLCGWSLTLAYLAAAAASLAAFAHFTTLVLNEFGLQVHAIWLYLGGVGLTWYCAYTDIRLSTTLMLVLGFISVGILLVLAGIVLAKQGIRPDAAQLSLQEASPSGLSSGIAIAYLGFTGFESATTLGDEAKRPLQWIPRSLIWSILLSGIFFMLMSYTEVLGFQSYAVPLNQSSAPLSVLANQAGVTRFGVGLNLAILLSCFGCTLAALVAGARVAFALGRHRLYPSCFAGVHVEHKTPYITVTLISAFIFLVPASMLLLGIRSLDAYYYIAAFGIYGSLFAYLIVSFAAPVYLHQHGRLRHYHLITSSVSTIFIITSIVGSCYSAPASPFNVFPYLFLLYLAAGGCLFTMLQRRSPRIIEEIQRDLDTMHNHGP